MNEATRLTRFERFSSAGAARDHDRVVVAVGGITVSTVTNTVVLSAAGSSASNGTIVLSDSNNVSFGMNGSTITATASFAGGAGNFSAGVSTLGNTAGNTGLVGSRLVLAGINGITLSESTVAGGSATVTIDAALQTVQTLGLYATGAQTVGESSSTTRDARSVSISGAGLVSAGFSAGVMLVSATAPAVTNSSVTLSDAATSVTLARLAFTDLNGISMRLSTGAGGSHTLTASYTVPTVTNSSATLSDPATSVTLARLAFTNLNNITLSLSTGAGGSHTLVGSVAAGGGGDGFNRIAAGTVTAATLQTVVFSDSNGMVFGLDTGANSSVLTASCSSLVPGSTALSVASDNDLGTQTTRFARADHVHAGLHRISIEGTRTSGTTSAGAGSFALAGGPNVTLSCSTAAGGMTVSVSGADPGGGGQNTLSRFLPFGLAPLGIAAQQGQGSLHMCPFDLEHYLSHDRVCMPVVFTAANNSTLTASLSMLFGIYTKNVNTLSQLTSYSTLFTINHSGTVCTSLFNNTRLLTFGATGSLSSGSYWAAVLSRTSSSSNNASLSQIIASALNMPISGILGGANLASIQTVYGMGVLPGSTFSTLPASVAFSDLRGSSIQDNRPPIWYLISESVA